MGRSELAVSEIAQAFTPSAITADNDLRIVSVTIAAYDYLVTLPAEYRFYQSSNRRSSGLVLFVLIRYTSVIVLVVSNVGFFYHGFTPNTCGHFHLAVPALKVVQTMVSQAILAIRAYNISQRKHWVGRTLLLVYIMATGFQWFSSLFSRMPVSIDGNCTSASIHPQRAISTWSFYLVAMLYDCLTLSISAVYLIKVKSVAPGTSRLFKILLYDGLGYFVVLTFTNLANILMFRGTDHLLQSTGASFEYSVTWIMSQRILIHLRDARTDQTPVVLAPLPSSREVTSASRFEKGMKHPKRAEQGHTPGSQDQFSNTKSDLELQVRIDKSIVVDARAQDKSPKLK